MKKLMVVAALISAAIAGNAANVNWSITGLQDSTGAALASGYVYTYSTKEGTYRTIDGLEAALSGAKTVAAVQAILDESYSGLNGSVSSGSYSTSVPVGDSGLSENKKSTKLFAVIIDSATFTKDSKWYVTQETSGAAATPTTSGISPSDYAIADTGSHTAANWHSIPEPTSGLLLMLGFAGLALRRRRA